MAIAVLLKVGFLNLLGFTLGAFAGVKIADRYDHTATVAAIGGWLGLLTSTVPSGMIMAAFGVESSGYTWVTVAVLVIGTAFTEVFLPGYGTNKA